MKQCALCGRVRDDGYFILSNVCGICEKIREEVADLTIAATEKVARVGLSKQDQLRLIQEAINEIDLSKVSEN